MRAGAALQQPEAGGLRDRGRARRHVELRRGVGDVTVDGVLADEEPLGDRLVAEAVGDQPEDLDLARASGRSVLVGPGRPAAAGRRQASSTRCARATARGSAPSGVRSSMRAPGLVARRVARPSAPSTRASSTRARPVSNGAPLSWNRSTASSRCRRGRTPDRRDRAASSPPARLADARSGSVRASLAMSSSSASACAASSVRPSSSAGADQQLQRGRALGAVLRGQPAQIAIGQFRAALKSPRSNVTLARPSDAERMGSAALEQRHALRPACPAGAAARRAAPALRRSWPDGAPPARRRPASAPARLRPTRRATCRPRRTACGTRRTAAGSPTSRRTP